MMAWYPPRHPPAKQVTVLHSPHGYAAPNERFGQVVAYVRQQTDFGERRVQACRMSNDRPKKFRYLTQDEFEALSVPEKVAYLHDALEAVHKMAPTPPPVDRED